MDLGSETKLESERKSLKSLLTKNKLFTISARHPNTFERYRSYAEIVAERRRHLIESGDNIIHPYSLFNLYWKSLMLFINIAHMMSSIFRLCYVLEKDEVPRLCFVDWALLAIYFICYIDVYVTFNTGYSCDETNVVLNRRRIFWHYLRGWFTIDLFSCLPLAFILLNTKLHTYRYLLLGHLIPLLRVLRLATVLGNLNTFMKTFTGSFICLRIVRHILTILFSIHYSNCTIYMLPMLTYYWEGKMPGKYVLFLGMEGGQLTKFTCSERYMKALFITLSSLSWTVQQIQKELDKEYYDPPPPQKLAGYTIWKNTEEDASETERRLINNILPLGVNPAMLIVTSPEEFVVFSVIVFYHAMFMVYTVVFLLKIYMTVYNSMTRYHGLMSQIEAYMQHKQLPVDLRKRLRQFYRYSFQEKYYKEDDTLACLSDQLRHEIILYTCHKLVNRLPLLEGLPAGVVGAVLGCLIPEVYLPNDLVMRAGDVGQCMYFIANGTVAVYSLKGAEICHLEDGDHFGEVALLMRDSKRVATVVSVEITQVYRLDSSDFRLIVNSNKVLYDRLQTLASQRMHQTVVLDDEFRRRREGGDLDTISLRTN